jgi:transcriptional regulator with XRE-family HTH domain
MRNNCYMLVNRGTKGGMSMTLGERIKLERERRGWTRATLAQRAGLTAPYISMLEAGKRGNPNLDTLRQLAAALELSVADLESEPDDLEPFPAPTLREWGVPEADIAQYRAAWPYWSQDQRAKFRGDLRTILIMQARVRELTERAQAKKRALEHGLKADDEADGAAPPLAPQIAM